MASIRDLINRIAQARDQIIANREREVLTLAGDQIALIKLRLQTEGVNAQRQPWIPYTSDYAKRRAKDGYQVKFVDFTITGRTLASIVPIVVNSNLLSTTVEIRPGSDETRAIIAGLNNKRPGILDPSQDEIRILREGNIARILKYLNF